MRLSITFAFLWDGKRRNKMYRSLVSCDPKNPAMNVTRNKQVGYLLREEILPKGKVDDCDKNLLN